MRILFKVSSQDKNFLDFYGLLAKNLQGHGIVYTPYPVVPPNARMALPTPTEVLVTLDSSGDFDIVERTISSYLKRFPKGELQLEKNENRMTITSRTLSDAHKFRDEMFAKER